MTKFIKLLGKPVLGSQLHFPIVSSRQNRVSPWVRLPSKITNNSRKVTSSNGGLRKIQQKLIEEASLRQPFVVPDGGSWAEQ